MAKAYVCDTRQGLHVGGCGALTLVFCRTLACGCLVSGSGVEMPTVEGESPVREDQVVCVVVDTPSSSGLVESAVNWPGPPGKPEYLI